MKDVQNFINDLIIEFTASVCVKHLDAIQVGVNSCKGIKDKLGVFMCSGTETYDFPVEKINEKANVVPFVIYPFPLLAWGHVLNIRYTCQNFRNA